MFKNRKNLLVYIIAFGFLTSCSSQSESEMIKEVESAVESNFDLEISEANQEGKGYEYKRPRGVKEKSITKNNIILENGNQLYTLFYDPKNHDDSHLIEEEKKKDKNPLLFKELENEELSFVKIVMINEKEYELTIGKGGIKITTINKLSKLDNEAELMTEIINSFNFK